MKVKLAETGKRDERIDFVVDQTKVAVGTFTEAIKKSTEDQLVVSFKAFTLKADRTESDKVFDLIMNIVAVELHEQAEKMTKEYTFFHSVEAWEEGGEQLGFSLILHCDKTRKPPTKEEVEDALKKSELVEEEKKENEVVLPHASGIEYYKRPGSE